MANVSGTASFTFSAVQRGALGINPNGQIPDSDTWSLDLTNGIGVDQFNLKHSKTYSLAASTPQIINLYDGSLLDIYGGPAAFRRLILFAYRLQATNDTFSALIGGAGANEWIGWLAAGSKVQAFPSTAGGNHGWTVITAPNATGMPVTPTSRLLKIDPGLNAVGAFDVLILGRDI